MASSTAQTTSRFASSTLSRYAGRGQGEGSLRAPDGASTGRPSPLPLPEYRERVKSIWRLAFGALLTLCVPLHALAHAGPHPHGEPGGTSRGPADFHQLIRTWAFEPGVVIPLALTGWLYAQGLWRLWRASGVGHGVKRWEAISYALGWFALVVALVSPLHPWGGVLFAAHMSQHEILMLVAAPLLVLGRPMAVLLHALPSSWSRNLALVGNAPSWLAVWRSITNPLAAWTIHGAVLWLWHAPALMQAVLQNEFVHALQHISFLLSALLFWWALIHGRQSAMNYGLAVLYMFTTALHTGLLGILLTFATRIWYPAYSTTTQSWGLSPLEDQQLGGLIMWIPAGIVYIIAGLALTAGWIRESEARVLRREQGLTPATTLASSR